MCDDKFNLLMSFLEENPDRLSTRKKINKDEYKKDLYLIYKKARETKPQLSIPKTIPDDAVSVILQETQGFLKEQTETIKIEHQLSMASENLVGTLLERYIAKILEPHGWVWCAGDFIRAIDFIKYDKSTNTWKAVQVKNRDNTENSSSSAIRSGTDIQKWFRTYSKPSKNRPSNTNWESFPEVEFRHQLSEKGFLEFIRTSLSG